MVLNQSLPGGGEEEEERDEVITIEVREVDFIALRVFKHLAKIQRVARFQTAERGPTN